MKLPTVTAYVLTSLLATVPASPVMAAEPADLRAEILAADARLFGAINQRDIAAMKQGFSPRLEFYHDRTGLTGYADNIRIFENKFKEPGTLRREAMNDTAEVFPAGPDRAMHIGSHRFCSAEAPGAKEGCGVYRFSMVWEKEAGTWKLLRVLSYGH
ncbi:nuclear transport factor 2 family protein [Oxalobacteraceae bacterium OTU3CINTB1]|nr:nuclear transport factor 2 family protein [Oxalobacteraceae bacterium OTU3CINTB1]